MAVPKINFSRLRPIRGVSQVPQSLREPTCSDRSYHGRRCPRPRSSYTLESPPACACPRCMNGTRSLSTARCAPVRCGRLSIEKFPDMARGAGCRPCAAPDSDYIWTSERWRLCTTLQPTGLPVIVLLEPRAHFGEPGDLPDELASELGLLQARDSRDRKSTRLNSSHQIISYAVFCLKKKK